MYGETGAAMRTHLTTLLAVHRIQIHHPEPDPAVRSANTQAILRYRQTVLTWCGQALRVTAPMSFTNLPPRNPNPFRPDGNTNTTTELARALAHARDETEIPVASTDLLTTPSPNPLVEGWRQVAKATALAEHDTAPAQTARLTTDQAQALIGDVAAITQALVILDQRYKNTPGWTHLAEGARLGRTALAASLDVQLGQPDYSIDDTGWRPRTKPLRFNTPRPGILGVLQAEHDLTVSLAAFPHLVNLRVIVDSQRILSTTLARLAAPSQPALAQEWAHRAGTYTQVQRDLRELGGLLGNGNQAASFAATAIARLNKLEPQTIVEPRVLGGFQNLFTRIDHRITDIVEEGLQRKAFTQRVTLPQLDNGTGRAVQPLRERHRPISNPDDLGVLATVTTRLRSATPDRDNRPDASRAEIHAALIHRPTSRRQANDAHGL